MLNVQVQMLFYAIIIYLVFRFLYFIKIISIPGRGSHGRMVVGITTMQSVPRFGNKKTKAPKQDSQNWLQSPSMSDEGGEPYF
jgi:hypothetical protein